MLLPLSSINFIVNSHYSQFILLLLISHINSDTFIYNEMNESCTYGKYENYSRINATYKTIHEFYNEKNIGFPASNMFFNTLFKSRSKGNLSSFIKVIYGEVTIIAMSVGLLGLYGILVFCWVKHRCLFKKISKKKRLKYRNSCRHGLLLLIIILFSLIVLLCLIGMNLMFTLKRKINLSECALLQYMENSLNGNNSVTVPRFPGINYLSDALKTKYVKYSL